MLQKFLLAFLGLFPFSCYADIVPVDRAEEAAQHFFSHNVVQTKQKGMTNAKLKLVWPADVRTSRSALQDAPSFYVFNHGNQEGFVIISGDDAVHPVLAYAFEGSFGTENMPENLKGWMDYVDHEMASVRSQALEQTDEVAEQWRKMETGRVVVKMDTPLWDQDKPYNSKCPIINSSRNQHAYTGCLITAAAIVMGYHQWPERGEGKLQGYTVEDWGIQVPGVNLNDHPYLWEKMPGINGNVLPYDKRSEAYKEQEVAVATLMRDLGVMCKAKYRPNGTGAIPYNLYVTMPWHMKYNEGMMHLTREKFSDQRWRKILVHELDHNRPIVYSGFGEKSGHAFVLDGYDTKGFFSVNWGWSGDSNGFFDINGMDPNSQGAGGGSHNYNSDQEATMRVLPAREGLDYEDYECMTFIEMSSVAKGLSLTDGDQVLAQGERVGVSAGRFCNLGTHEYNGAFQLVITNPRGSIKQVLYTTPRRSLFPGDEDMPFSEQRNKVTVTLEQPIAAGDRIRLVYQGQDGTTKPVMNEEADVPWEIVLKEGDAAMDGIEVRTVVANNLADHAVATYSADIPTMPSEPDVEAYYAVEKDAQTIEMKKIEPGEGPLVVPANTGVVLSTKGARSFKMLPVQEAVSDVPKTNLLCPTALGVTVELDDNAYILAKEKEAICFFKLNESDRYIPANHSYLSLPSHNTVMSVKMDFDELMGVEETAVEQQRMAEICDLSGRRVNRIVKGGIYIKNGKKFIVR